jgi:hypothetical protein
VSRARLQKYVAKCIVGAPLNVAQINKDMCQNDRTVDELYVLHLFIIIITYLFTVFVVGVSIQFKNI